VHCAKDFGRWYSDSCRCSLGSGTERSANLEVIVDLTSSGASVEGHVGACTASSTGLDVDVGDIINGESLTLSSVKMRFSLVKSSVEVFTFSVLSLSSGNVMEGLQESVVLLVSGELKRVLVVGEESVVSIGKVSEGTFLYTKRISGQLLEYLPCRRCRRWEPYSTWGGRSAHGGSRS